MIGKTVNIYGRNFLIYDCDMFTKTFYAKNFGVSHFETVETQIGRTEYPKMVRIDRRERDDRRGVVFFKGNSSI